MKTEVRLNHHTGQIVAAAIAKAEALKRAGQDNGMFKSAQRIEIPNPEGKFEISDLQIGSKHSFIDIKLVNNDEQEHLHAKFCDKKLVLTAKDEYGNILGSNTMQLAQVRK